MFAPRKETLCRH